MVERALRKIEAELVKLAAEELIDPNAVRLAATRIGAQAEMLEKGIAGGAA